MLTENIKKPDYDKLLSSKCKSLKPSGIRKFFDLAANMEGIVSLGVGEPDFATPWFIRERAISALEHGKTVYTANSGILELRRAISEYLVRRMNVAYDPEREIIVTVGGSEAIDLAIRALIDTGDEAIIVEPSFVCYKPIVELCGGTPVIIETVPEEQFKLTPEKLLAAITAKTKILILPFPNNPTGAIMEREDLEPIAEILRQNEIITISDEIYAELTYGSTKHISIASLPGMRERTLMVNGFSKAYAMTGWRLGYICGVPELITQMLKIHQYAIMCSPTVSQYAAVDALRGGDKDVARMCEEYNIRRRWIVAAFNEIGLSCFEPKGAFYVFPSIKSTGLSSEEFCERLLNEKHVAVVPGNAFGDSGEGYIRVSYAYSLSHLMTAVEKIDEFLTEHNLRN
ncbi:MAG: aminotransferase class I/II-fold pyridoxal phosphate-dependent enzyme [Ruminococcus sp.]|jgi:aminotransferase|nr:aminotransferase class I/II-fold pyridoxal phosphate-dependent enzyme [Ruminococcus sp.]